MKWRRIASPRALLLLALTSLAAILRFRGIDFGLPDQSARPDEEVVVRVALSIAWERDLNPHHFSYGGAYYYLVAATYLLYLL